MAGKQITPHLTVEGQIAPADVAAIAAAGFRTLMCNRPDGEGGDQPSFAEIAAAAKAAGLETIYLPVESGKVTDADAAKFGAAFDAAPKPIFAYCRSGTRCTTLWALSEGARGRPLPEILASSKAAGYDMSGVIRRIANGGKGLPEGSDARHEVVIIGGGAAGVAVAASLKARKPDLDIAIIDPADVHYYQPGWTLVGAGVFKPESTAKPMGALIPKGVKWIKAAVAAFEPQRSAILLDGCRIVEYGRLIVAPGIKLNWGAIPGLNETLGRNGVTSNYRYDLAPYTWELVQGLKSGRAIFTQPPMPIKCAGAPQKALYLSADHWTREGRLKDVRIDMFSAGVAVFGVAAYVPALMEYVKKYRANFNFAHTLTRIDGPSKTAWFKNSATEGPGAGEIREEKFDMIHVVPPQSAPDFVRASPLADAAGWVDVHQDTLRHKTLPNVYGLGDACNAPNAKTAAAARKQAPVVAHNLLKDMGVIQGADAVYDGYGSCPLTVERGKIVLAEFGYGGKLLPSFPKWLIDGEKPSALAWLLKERLLPPVYWQAMLKGREWMAQPETATKP